MPGNESLAGVLLLAPYSPGASILSGPDAAAVREVIEAQLDAFRRDDAQRAFSFAAPVIREQFGTAENFMQMVRTSYAVVYRPRSVKFETFEVVDNQVFQPVRMTDADGQAWVAIYGWSASPTEAGASTAAGSRGFPSARPDGSSPAQYLTEQPYSCVVASLTLFPASSSPIAART
jgi:hypothetical protein